MISENRSFDKFLKEEMLGFQKLFVKKIQTHTRRVNTYGHGEFIVGNNIGISAKKSSSYSSSLIARMARLASGDLSDGGNLPFCSHDSMRIHI